MNKLLAMTGVVFALATAVAAPTLAQNFPDHTIRLIVPYPPGGPSDTTARVGTQGLGAELGQSVIIENVVGAGGKIGTKAAIRATPDGYTLFNGSINEYAIMPALYKNLDFDPVKGFAPVAAMATDSNVLVIHPSVPAQTLAELVRYAKDHPGKLTSGSTIGIAPHLLLELFRARTGTDWIFVPYKGAAPAITDVLANQIQVYSSTKAVLLPHIRAGKLRPLAVTSAERWPELPDVPTLSESGLGGYPADLWFGLMAPAGTPAPVIAKINAAENARLKAPEVQAAIQKLGMQPRIMSAQEFGDVLREQATLWDAVARETGVKIE
jgi:tripartite-type tricarboxylate transporter receptor subunit TctC